MYQYLWHCSNFYDDRKTSEVMILTNAELTPDLKFFDNILAPQKKIRVQMTGSITKESSKKCILHKQGMLDYCN